MVYTHKSPALLIIGIVMLAWGWLNQSGTADGLQAWLHPGAYKEQKQAVEKHQAAEKAAVDKAAAEYLAKVEKGLANLRQWTTENGWKRPEREPGEDG